MTTRCVECNKGRWFRNQRGNKLSDYSCDCGGKLEIIGGSHALAGKYPFDEKCTYTSEWFEGEYFYAERNRKGEYFVYHEGFYHKIENPILPTRKQIPAGTIES